MFQAADDKILKTTTVKSLLKTNAELYNTNTSLLRSSFGPKDQTYVLTDTVTLFLPELRSL